MGRILRRCVRDTRGATAIEYGLIISLVVLAMMVALVAVADGTIGMWTNVTDSAEAVW
ncbi:MAG: Flp family type IVb pilin [Sphingomonadaceae bacterium]|nr:Flp family type IVb pilin [Sphingomonadaceae bacterium]